MMNKRIYDIEFRWSPSSNIHELVQWFEGEDYPEYCIVIAFFDEGSEGCDIRFVGDRPFNTGESETVWKMLRYGQSIVDAAVNLKEEEIW